MKALAALLGVPKAATWDAIVAALATAGRTATFAAAVDETDDGVADPLAVTARIGALAKAAKLPLPADAWAWLDPAVYASGSEDTLVRFAIASALSSMDIGLVRLVDPDPRRFVVALVPWAARDRIVAAARAAKVRMIALGPKAPKPRPKPARALPATVARARLLASSVAPFVMRPDGFVTEVRKTGAVTLDLTRWPPTQTPLRGIAVGSLRAIAFHPATDEVLAAVTDREEGRLRISRGGRALAIPDTLHRDNLSTVGFLDDDAIALGDSYYRGKPLRARRGDDRFAPIASLPSADTASIGLARTGAGDGVLICGGIGYAAAGKALKARFTLVRGSVDDTAPLAGDAFVAAIGNTLYAIAAGAKPARRMASLNVAGIAAAPDGALVVRTFDKVRSLVAWWPAERAIVTVPLADFGLRGKAIVFAHGVAAGRLWVYDAIGNELRALPWDAIAARPRTKER